MQTFLCGSFIFTVSATYSSSGACSAQKRLSQVATISHLGDSSSMWYKNYYEFLPPNAPLDERVYFALLYKLDTNTPLITVTP